MVQATQPSPTLVADVGTFITRVCLLERVDESYRLAGVARVPSTIAPPASDTMLGISRALAELERTTGWAASQAASADVRRLVVTSVKLTVATSVLSLVSDRALQRILEFLQTLPITPLDIFDLVHRPPDAYQYIYQRLLDSPLDMIMVFGSEAADWEAEVARVGELLAQLVSHHRSAWQPTIAFVGPATQGQVLRTFLGDRVPLHQVSVLSFRSEHLDLSPLFTRVTETLQRARLSGLPNFSGLSAWAEGPPVDYLELLRTITRQIAERYGLHVLTLDLGASHAAAVSCTEDGTLRQIALDGFGMRRSLQNILAEVGVESIARWLPYDLNQATLDAFLLKRIAHPAILPTTIEDLLLEHAFAREALRSAVELLDEQRFSGIKLPSCAQADLVLGCGSTLARVPRLIQAMWLMIDAVQPVGLTQFALDRAGALPVFLLDDAVMKGNPLIEHDVLLALGVSISPVGQMGENRVALRVQATSAEEETSERQVHFGSMDVIRWPGGPGSKLAVWPASNLDIGVGRGRGATPRAELEGGSVGVVIDARGRPLRLASNRDKRQAKLLEWMQSLGAYPTLSFSERLA